MKPNFLLALSLLTPLLFASVGASCGSPARNKPLANHVESAHLAPVPAASRGAEADAKQSVFIAEWQLEYTKAQIAGAKLAINIAKNDLASAKLGLKSAGLTSDAANESEEQNRMQRGENAKSTAQMQVEMNTHAIEKAKQNLAFLSRRLIHEEKMHRSQQAKFEYIKAELLGAAAIAPPKFDRKAFKGQLSSRNAEVKSDMSGLNAAKAKLDSATKTWSAAKAKTQSMQNSTMATPEESTPTPMAPPPEIKNTEPDPPTAPDTAPTQPEEKTEETTPSPPPDSPDTGSTTPSDTTAVDKSEGETP
ncbi:MAG: hypothetical protein JKY56_20965 [Kofleriaceae bacterium]|nr:hypothetical protein [Kofleriaceae bacterium]